MEDLSEPDWLIAANARPPVCVCHRDPANDNRHFWPVDVKLMLGPGVSYADRRCQPKDD